MALIALCLAWEAWLAPLRPGGSALIFKTLPLLVPLFGILRRKIYTYQWSSMMMYFTEGIARAYSEHGPSAKLAALEIAFSVIFLASSIVRLSAKPRPIRVAAKSGARCATLLGIVVRATTFVARLAII